MYFNNFPEKGSKSGLLQPQNSLVDNGEFLTKGNTSANLNTKTS